MRRNLTFLLGTATGACLTILVAGPQGAHLVAAAKAAARSDSTYSPLNLSGDVITQIDEDSIQWMTLDQAVAKMKGQPDSKIRLKIIRKGADAPVDVAIVREVIRVRPVRFRTEGGDIGYIRISSFNEQATDGL